MEDLLPISALQHYAYCPRQFALIHVEQVWAENRFTAEGRILHTRVDAGEPEQRGKVRFERGVLLLSQHYGLSGKMDLLEVEEGESRIYRPVEYKRGKPKTEEWDRIQLCAQALCLEEMRDCHVKEGAIWYWETRHRERVTIDEALRSLTISIIEAARHLLAEGITPRPIEDRKRCRACSLNQLCQPDRFRKDRSARYVQALFRE
ncbi:CRISPR-associated protein Cas4 [Marinobacteraceae bacterium S3BR75-40.1]